jgi:hypothetical protein
MSVLPADVAVELGVAAPTDLQDAQWQSWIGQAMYLIGKRLDIATLDPKDVDYVVLRAVVEHAQNPQNATQVDVSVDDGRVSKRYASGSGAVSISDALWSLLDPDFGTSGAFTIQSYGEPDPSPIESWA